MALLGHKLLVIRKKKDMNQSDFAKLLGISRPTYAAIENNEKEADRNLLYKMSKVLSVPESELTNEKEEPEHTLVGESPISYKKRKGTIPFYDAIVVGGNAMLANQESITDPVEYVDPGDFFRKATGVITVYGHSCFPKYPAGCKVAFRDADKELIYWGEDYVIETEERRIIKRLERHEDRTYVKAVSYNKSEAYVYADIDIPLSKIKRLYMVLGKIELEASI